MMRLGRIFVFSATSSISSFFASRACCNFLPTDSTIFTDWFKIYSRRYITAKYPLLHLLFTRAHLSPLESPVASPRHLGPKCPGAPRCQLLEQHGYSPAVTGAAASTLTPASPAG